MAVTGSFNGVGVSASFKPDQNVFGGVAFSVFVSGNFTGVCNLQRSPDDGVTWYDITALGVTLYQYDAPGSEDIEPTSNGLLYRLNCTSWQSGTINYTLG